MLERDEDEFSQCHACNSACARELDGQPRSSLSAGQCTLEEGYLKLIENLTDFVFTIGLDGRILKANRQLAVTLGYEPDELIGEPLEKIIAIAVRNQVPYNLGRVIENGYAEGVSQYQAKDGSIRYFEYRCKLVGGGRRPSHILVAAKNITDRVLSKKAVKESETKSQLLVQHAHDGIAYIDAKGHIQFANRRLKEILRDCHPEGKPLTDYCDDQNRKILEENLRLRPEGKSSTYFVTLTDLEGGQHDLVISGTPHFDRKGEFKGAIGVYTDITRLKKLDEQLQQSQKMQAIGTLAGGIAHDFNNILSAVLGYASLMRRNAQPGSQLARYAEMIEKSAERGAELSGKLLAFSREGKRYIRDVNVHQVMDDLVEILNHTFDRNVTISFIKNARQPVVAGDPGQIQQLLMNLCINAKDAMPGGGTLTLSTDEVCLDEAFCRDREGLSPGAFLKITIKDTGLGMNEEVKRRLFEPFFTTKEEGKGTGLGLATVYGAVRNHGGTIEVLSEPDCGSSFTVMLPLRKGPATEIVPVQHGEPARGAGTVLVVDDEPIIRQLVPEILTELGFRPIIAQDGREAVQIYGEQWRRIDLVILDMIMPGMNGRETFKAMKQINPEVKALLSTGFSAEGPAEDAIGDGIIALIRKPYRPEELADAISRALSPA